MNNKKKHSFEFKINCVKQMYGHYRSAKSIGNVFEVSCSLFDTCYKIDKFHGASWAIA